MLKMESSSETSYIPRSMSGTTQDNDVHLITSVLSSLAGVRICSTRIQNPFLVSNVNEVNRKSFVIAFEVLF